MFSLPVKTFKFNALVYCCRFICFLFCAFASLNAFGTPAVPPEKPSTEQPEMHNEHYPFPFEEANADKEEADHFFYQFIKMLGTLGLLVGLMLLASWFLKRMLSTQVQQINTSSYIRVIEHRPLSNRSSLYLVEAQGKTFIVGESMQGLSLITNFSKPFSEYEITENNEK